MKHNRWRENPEQCKVWVRMAHRADHLLSQLPVVEKSMRKVIKDKVTKALVRAYWTGAWERTYR